MMSYIDINANKTNKSVYRTDLTTQSTPVVQCKFVPNKTYGNYSSESTAERIDSLYLDQLARDIGYKFLGGGNR